jgi:ketosteroid isomerase-like protein
MTEHAQLVHRFYEAWSANDVDGVLAVLHPDIDFRPILGVLYEQDGFHGHDDMAKHVRELHAKWDDFQAKVELTRDLGDKLIAFVLLTGIRAGIANDARIAVEVGFRDGLISSFVGRDLYETAEELDIPV